VHPHTILIAEMLLRKTKAESAEPVVRSVLAAYPTLEALRDADELQLAEQLRPIGLHRIRAKALKAVASELLECFGGVVPRDESALVALPHVGRYAANAILCFAFSKRTPVVDGNVVRVFSRMFEMRVPLEIHRADDIWAFAAELLPVRAFRNFNLALLDFGALVCKPRNPDHKNCPLNKICIFNRGLINEL
jgi:A/G-specific adenine glycosylase